MSLPKFEAEGALMARRAMLAIAEIPPLAFQDYPVDAQIRIYGETRFSMDILAGGQPQRVPINVSLHDLEELNEQLQEEMDLVARALSESQPTTVDLETLLRPLAEMGNYAFKQVFGHHDALTAIHELLALSRNVSFQITSEGFFLPWELLYPESLEEPLSCECFWGMKHIISRLIVQDAHPGAFVSPLIQFASRPSLGLLTYYGLPHVEDSEIPFFEKLQDEGKVRLFKLRALNASKWMDEYQEFKRFWDTEFDLAHFACHALFANERPMLSRILLSDQFPISLKDMEVYGFKANGHPLIVLNACETGNLNPLYTASFARAFLQCGARGVVATECAVPDSFAADFAEQLYGHLLAGQPLGESLLATRRYFLEKHNNPSGLLYSMYAPPSIRLVQAGG